MCQDATEVWLAEWIREGAQLIRLRDVMPHEQAVEWCNTHQPWLLDGSKRNEQLTWDLVDVETQRLVSHLAWDWEA